MNIDKLKQKILDLAVKGKLIPQSSDDEPASILLNKIEEEKKRLIKQGLIKKSKKDSIIFVGEDDRYYEKIGNETKDITDEIPFEIPNTWEWVRLKALGDIVGGGTPSTENKDYWNNGDVVWVTPAYMSTLSSIYLSDSLRKITQSGLEHSSARLMPAGSVIMSSRAPIGYLAINTVPASTSQGCKSVVPFIKDMSEYLLYFIKASIGRILNASSGTTFDEISGTQFGELLIPLAPLNEQKAIVKTIDSSYALIEKIALEYQDIDKYVSATKRKVLDVIFGENSLYQNFYPGTFVLGDILIYEQPGPYIVSSTNYSPEYKTPVLTPGKSFILGYTNETDGIYHPEDKVIIFDDFTTASRLIDFDFKVKSSAMKILHIEDKARFNIDYFYYLLNTIHINCDTHKRFWISEYATKTIMVHDINDQSKIVDFIKNTFKMLDELI